MEDEELEGNAPTPAAAVVQPNPFTAAPLLPAAPVQPNPFAVQQPNAAWGQGGGYEHGDRPRNGGGPWNGDAWRHGDYGHGGDYGAGSLQAPYHQGERRAGLQGILDALRGGSASNQHGRYAASQLRPDEHSGSGGGSSFYSE